MHVFILCASVENDIIQPKCRLCLAECRFDTYMYVTSYHEETKYSEEAR